MADTAVAITAIVVSGVVGPSLSAVWSRARQRADQRRDSSKELREVLDEGAHALGESKRAFEYVWVLYSNKCPPDDDRAVRASDSWRQALARVRFAEDRIAIRLGDGHEIHLAFVDCMKSLERRRPFARAYERGELTDEELQEQVAAHEGYKGLRSAYITACKGFLDSGRSA